MERETRGNPKRVEIEEIIKSMKSDKKLTFGKEAPFSYYTKPKSAILVGWYGDFDKMYVMQSSGTMVIVRGDQKHWNVDIHSILYNPEKATFVSTEVFTDYHKISSGFDNLPDYIKEAVSKDKELEKEIRNK